MTTSIPTDRRSRSSGGPRLFERGEYLREFEAIFGRVQAVPSGCIYIEGPWGSGRTALLNSGCDIASRYGCLVLRAKGGEMEEQTPYAVLGDLVDSAVALVPATSPSRQMAMEVKNLLTSENRHDQTLAAVRCAFVGLLSSVRHHAPVVLAVDDADQADTATLAVLEFVLRRMNDRQVWLLGSGLSPSDGMGPRAVDGLLAGASSRYFILGPLKVDSVRRMLDGLVGEKPDEPLVRACGGATAGLPLFLKAFVTSLRGLDVRPTAESTVSIEQTHAPRISRLVLNKLSKLPPMAIRYLQVCAVLGDEADPGVAGPLAGIDLAAAERATELAERLELIRSGRPVLFIAPVVRWAIYHNIPTATRSTLHANAARLLMDQGADVHDVARHLLRTDPLGDAEVAEQLQQIGRSALVLGDATLARNCFERALEEFPPAQRTGSSYLDLVSAQLDQPASALLHLRRALELGGLDDTRVVEAGVGLIGSVIDKPDLMRDAGETLRNLTGRRSAVDGRLLLEFELGLEMISASPDQRNGASRLEQALEDCQLPGDVVHHARTFLQITDQSALPSLSASDQAARLTAEVNVDRLLSTDPVVEKIQTAAVVGLLCADRFDDVEVHLEVARDRAREEDRPSAEIRISYLLATSLLWRGSLKAAERGFRTGRYSGTSTAAKYQALHTLGLVATLVQQGRIDEATRRFDGQGPPSFDDATFRACALVERGRLILVGGDPGAALEDFYRAGDEQGTGIPNPALISWRADAAMALVSLGEHDEARHLADEHLQLARRYGTARMIGVGLRAKAAAAADVSEKIKLLYEAVDLLQSSPARLESARALVELGAILVGADRKEEARDLLRRGGQIASTCGARTLMDVAWVQLRTAGARSRRLGHDELDSLSPAEYRVVRLVARGKTNQVIAEELYLAPKTVEGHLARVFKKLGIRSRQELIGPLAGLSDGELLDESA